MRASRDPLPYLQDIEECIVRIKRYTNGVDLRRFLRDEIVQDAVVRRIELIGEAVGRLPDALRNRYPQVPWQEIKDMRNKLVHDYGHIDLELVWGVVLHDLPQLELEIRRIIEQES